MLSRYVDAIMIRTFAQKDVEDLRDEGSIPVINGLTDAGTPARRMADLLTIREHFGELAGGGSSTSATATTWPTR